MNVRQRVTRIEDYLKRKRDFDNVNTMAYVVQIMQAIKHKNVERLRELPPGFKDLLPPELKREIEEGDRG